MIDNIYMDFLEIPTYIRRKHIFVLGIQPKAPHRLVINIYCGFLLYVHIIFYFTVSSIVIRITYSLLLIY